MDLLPRIELVVKYGDETDTIATSYMSFVYQGYFSDTKELVKIINEKLAEFNSRGLDYDKRK